MGETLLLHGMVPSIGTVGDAFGNALAETTIGLYKHECIRGRLTVPPRTAGAVVGPGDDHLRPGTRLRRPREGSEG